MTHAFLTMEHSIAERERRLADVVILPDLSKVPSTDLAARGEMIRAGEEAPCAALPQIRLLIASKTASGASVKTGGLER